MNLDWVKEISVNWDGISGVLLGIILGVIIRDVLGGSK